MDTMSAEDQLTLESLGIAIQQLEEADLEAWFDHVALVFAKTGRGYFVDHYRAQPLHKYILVAKHIETKCIVSTMRIFEHQIIVGNAPVRCAGVGEVSTHPDWRLKGLAGILLRALQRLMISEGLFVSSLHTSSTSFYARFGYNLIPMESVSCLVQADAGGAKRLISGVEPLEAVTPVWKSLYRQLCERHILQGIVIRDDEYWAKRIPKEVQRLCGKRTALKSFSPLPLSADTPFAPGCGFQWVDPADANKCAVFLSAQIDSPDEKLPILTIREAIASSSLLHDVPTWSLVLSSFIESSIPPSWEVFTLRCHGALWRHFMEPAFVASVSTLGRFSLQQKELISKDGIMYKLLGGENEHHAALNDLQALKTQDHIFLPLDGF